MHTIRLELDLNNLIRIQSTSRPPSRRYISCTDHKIAQNQSSNTVQRQLPVIIIYNTGKKALCIFFLFYFLCLLLVHITGTDIFSHMQQSTMTPRDVPVMHTTMLTSVFLCFISLYASSQFLFSGRKMLAQSFHSGTMQCMLTPLHSQQNSIASYVDIVPGMTVITLTGLPCGTFQILLLMHKQNSWLY